MKFNEELITYLEQVNTEIEWICIDLIEPQSGFEILHPNKRTKHLQKMVLTNKYPPILVKETHDGYEILDGHHRLYLCKNLHKYFLKCIILTNNMYDYLISETELDNFLTEMKKKSNQKKFLKNRPKGHKKSM